MTCRRREGVWERIGRMYLAMLDEQDQLQWGHAFLDGTFVPDAWGGEAAGVTQRGKGGKRMPMMDGQGPPIGGPVAGAQSAEIRLAEATLRTVRVPRQRGPARCWSLTRAMRAEPFGTTCGVEASDLASPTAATDTAADADRTSCPTVLAGGSNGLSVGRVLFAASWSALSVPRRSIGLSWSLPSSSFAWSEF
jgi:hypothetical protein